MACFCSSWYENVYHHGLTDEEFEKIIQEIENEPRLTNLDRLEKRELLRSKVWKQTHKNGKIKLLLLGTGHSGKSTLFKSLKDCHKGYEDSDFNESTPVIRENIVNGISILIRKSQELYKMNPDKYSNCSLPMDDDNIIEALQLIKKYQSEQFTEALDYAEMKQLGIY